MSPLPPPSWSRWVVAHAALVTVGLCAAPFVGAAWSVSVPGAGSLLLFFARHGTLNAPNALTAFRLLTLVAALALEGPARWLAYLSVWILDGVDGAVARRTGRATPFGAQFDMEVDALFVATLGAELVGPVGAWTIGFGLIRSLYVLLRAARPHVIPAERRSTWGRWIFSFTVVALLLALWLGPGVAASALTVAAAGALLASFAPDYAALRGGTKGAS